MREDKIEELVIDMLKRLVAPKPGIIIAKLFETITYKGGSLSVTYTKFAQVIAENILETKKILRRTK